MRSKYILIVLVLLAGSDGAAETSATPAVAEEIGARLLMDTVQHRSASSELELVAARASVRDDSLWLIVKKQAKGSAWGANGYELWEVSTTGNRLRTVDLTTNIRGAAPQINGLGVFPNGRLAVVVTTSTDPVALILKGSGGDQVEHTLELRPFDSLSAVVQHGTDSILLLGGGAQGGFAAELDENGSLVDQRSVSPNVATSIVDAFKIDKGMLLIGLTLDEKDRPITWVGYLDERGQIENYTIRSGRFAAAELLDGGDLILLLHKANQKGEWQISLERVSADLKTTMWAKSIAEGLEALAASKLVASDDGLLLVANKNDRLLLTHLGLNGDTVATESYDVEDVKWQKIWNFEVARAISGYWIVPSTQMVVRKNWTATKEIHLLRVPVQIKVK